MNMNIVDMFNSLMYHQAPSRENCGHIEISGAFTGDIKNGMNVFVAPSGHIKGNIKTRALIIAGKVQGNVETYSLVIHSSGELIYNKLVYRELLVEDGGKMICRNGAPGRCGEPAVSRAPVSGTPKIIVPEAEAYSSQTPAAPSMPAAADPPPASPPPAAHHDASNKEVHFQSSF